MVKRKAISLYQPDDSFILETLLFADMMTEEDISMFELGEFYHPLKGYSRYVISSTINDLKSIFKNHFNVNV